VPNAFSCVNTELYIRQGSPTRRENLETWVQETAAILKNAPFIYEGCEADTRAVVSWLLNPPFQQIFIENVSGCAIDTRPLAVTTYWTDVAELMDHRQEICRTHGLGRLKEASLRHRGAQLSLS
jgi:hypothetical protein